MSDRKCFSFIETPKKLKFFATDQHRLPIRQRTEHTNIQREDAKFRKKSRMVIAGQDGFAGTGKKINPSTLY
jgi:hypothetical protein